MIYRISGLFLLACLFPFVTPVKLGFDSQPYALLLAILILAIISIKRELVINKFFLGFLITIIYGIVTFVWNVYYYNSPDYFTGFRSFFTLVNLPIGMWAFMNAKIDPSRIFKYIRYTIYIYFAVGLVQIVNRSFLSFLLARASTSESRGVYSLTVEPVEYSRMCIFFFILICLFKFYGYCDSKQFRRLSGLLLLQMLLSLAGTGFVWIVVIGVFFLLFNSGLSKMRLIAIFLGFLVLLTGIVYIGISYFPDKRLFYLLKIAFEQPEELAKSGGFILRSLNPVHSLMVGIGMYKGLGVGLAFPGGGEVNYAFLGPWFRNVGINVSGRSHGGMFSLIYELGVFAIPFIFAIYHFLFVGYKKHQAGISMLFITFTFFLVTVFDGPLSNPILILVISLFYYLDKHVIAKEE